MAPNVFAQQLLGEVAENAGEAPDDAQLLTAATEVVDALADLGNIGYVRQLTGELLGAGHPALMQLFLDANDTPGHGERPDGPLRRVLISALHTAAGRGLVTV